MSERQRDDAVVADNVQVELQLLAPEASVPDHRTLRRPTALLALVQGIMQSAQSIQAIGEHGLVGAVAWIGTMQQRHLPCLADQQAQPHDPQIGAFAFGVAPLGQFAVGRRRDVRVEVGGVIRQHARG